MVGGHGDARRRPGTRAGRVDRARLDVIADAVRQPREHRPQLRPGGQAALQRPAFVGPLGGPALDIAQLVRADRRAAVRRRAPADRQCGRRGRRIRNGWRAQHGLRADRHGHGRLRAHGETGFGPGAAPAGVAGPDPYLVLHPRRETADAHPGDRGLRVEMAFIDLVRAELRVRPGPVHPVVGGRRTGHVPGNRELARHIVGQSETADRAACLLRVGYGARRCSQRNAGDEGSEGAGEEQCTGSGHIESAPGGIPDSSMHCRPIAVSLLSKMAFLLFNLVYPWRHPQASQ